MERHNRIDGTKDEDQVKLIEENFINENFNLKCDHCDTIFSGFYDARRHYKDAHNDDNGYLRCCNLKLNQMILVRDHIRSHLNPESFKYVFFLNQIN